MLAVAGVVPDGAGWAFEFKWDGVRALTAVVPAGLVRAHSRAEREITRCYPELARLAQLVEETVLLDGELVALDSEGRPSFQLLQQRMQVQTPSARLLAATPVQYVVFDLLHRAGQSLLTLPYVQRRAMLADLGLNTVGVVRTPPHHIDIAGAELLEVARVNSLEGVVAKRLQSRYQPGRRSHAWIKTVLRHRQLVIVGGWTRGQGRRAGRLGALLLGVYDRVPGGRLRFVGHVGSGFSERALGELEAVLAARARDSSPFDDEVPGEYARHAQWVDPDLVGEVEHRDWTTENRLRHPAWKGLRPTPAAQISAEFH
jgi:bifunctional non-homologous end joining protein LigD